METAAQAKGLLPSQLSFKGAVQAGERFAAWLWTAGAEELVAVYRRLARSLAAMQSKCVSTARSRERKRRPKPYPFLKEPRPKKGTRLGEKACA